MTHTDSYQKLTIGIIGLSVMGRSLALNMADHGFKVGGYNRSREVTDRMILDDPHNNFHPFYELTDLVGALERPRKIMLMIQAGKPVDDVLDRLTGLLEAGDILMDCGNSFFEDTRRRHRALAGTGIHYYGVGISGGETGARSGPSIMPGGDADCYGEIQPILNAIAAQEQGEPCCAHIGCDGAGHYVKMVHNGIEYADMQLIAESYLLLKHIGGFSNQEMAELFREWNKGELQSYLTGITAEILTEEDDFEEGFLLDHILDSAGQKGTGRWTGMEGLRQGVDTSMITAACNARIMSNRVDERKTAASLLKGPTIAPSLNKKGFAGQVRKGLYTAKIIAYAQGFSLMADASACYGWNLDYGRIASIFRAGCIIQAEFLNDISEAFRRNPELDNLLRDSFFYTQVNENSPYLREAVGLAVKNGIPAPAMSNGVSCLDAFRGMPAGANLIQAQRDYFGAHTYRRTDREGIYHHSWNRL